MDHMSDHSAVWSTTALVVFITTVVIKLARRRRTPSSTAAVDLSHNRTPPPPPPVVSSVALVRLLHTFLTRGLQATIRYQCQKLGTTVFTVSFPGKKNVTFLVGPEVSARFYQGLDSEVSLNMYEFTVPILGKDVAYSVDAATRNEQLRFYSDALRPSMIRHHVGPMLQEVQDYFSGWGQQGTVDLGQHLGKLIMMITGRCLLGREVRENMFDEFFAAYHEMMDNGLHLSSMLFPYAPTHITYRRDRARAKLAELLAAVVRLRKGSGSGNQQPDVLQNLIDSRYKDGRATTESEIVGMMISLLVAASQSCSAAVTWTGARLLSHPRWLAVAIEEQKEIIVRSKQQAAGGYDDGIDYNTLMEMENLHRCIKEAIRMHPPTPMLLRKVHREFTIRTREGHVYQIPSGHTIASPILFNSNIPHIYKDPEVYDPGRFGPPREEDKVGGKFSYLGFGAGRHACLGEAYAYTQIKVVWCYLLRNFELQLVSPFPKTDWSKVVPEPSGKVIVSYKRITSTTA